VSVSVKDRLNLSISVAVGSSIQIGLFVVPFIVSLGLILGKPMTLFFDPFESVTLFVSVLTVNYVTQDGKSNWCATWPCSPCICADNTSSGWRA
jgi:Ca2+:H+ antiporter